MMEAIKLRIIFLNKLKKKNKKQRRHDHQVRERKDCQETREKAEKHVPLQ